MYKIAILGCENSHASIFLDIINGNEDFADVCVMGVYSEDKEAAERISAKYNVKLMEKPDELVGKVDAVMVTARHGAKHFELLKPYLPGGVVVFVDKPITISTIDAEMMAESFEKYGNRFTGGSVMKYCDEIKQMKKNENGADEENVIGGLVRAPIISNSEYGGIYFYAPHLIEMLCQVFGRFPKSVIGVRNEKCVTAIFRYNEYDVNAVFTEMNVSGNYYVLKMSKDDCFMKEVKIENKHFEEEFYTFYQLLKNADKQENIKDFFAPVYILSALERTLSSGKEERIMWKM